MILCCGCVVQKDGSEWGIATACTYHDLKPLMAERDALRADAERYRWLRDNRVGNAMHMGAVLYTPELIVPRNMTVAEIDAAIDAARKEKP